MSRTDVCPYCLSTNVEYVDDYEAVSNTFYCEDCRRDHEYDEAYAHLFTA